MKALSVSGKSTSEIKEALDRVDFKPTIGFLFISVKQDRKEVCRLLREKDIDILGATSCGEFVNGSEETGSIVLLLLDMPRDFYNLIFDHGTDVSLAASRIAASALSKFRNPGFIILTAGVSEKGNFMDGEILVRQIESIVGPEVNLFGGMAGDDLSLTGSYVFTDADESDTGILALVIDQDKIQLTGMAISGWKPIGISRTVTKSIGSLVYSIDDHPAMDLYLKYLGKEPSSTEEPYKVFEEIGFHYPFQVEREKGEPVMRTPVSYNSQEQALVCDFAVPQGAQLRFSMPPDMDIVEKVLADANELKNQQNADADALLIFSCAGRLSAMGPMTSLENDGLSEIWRAPMAGFYTYGEFGRAINGRQEFHSTTCCWVAIKEK